VNKLPQKITALTVTSHTHFLQSYTPFTRWSWLDELALRALVEPASSCKRGITEIKRQVTLCNLIWHVTLRSSGTSSREEL